MKRPHRRHFLHLAAGAAALPAVPHVARAQSYPARTVTIIVPVAAGGTTDVAARIIGEYMSRLLSQQFIVENATGAGGTTGSTRAMRARPDGYTIMMGHQEPMRSRSLFTSILPIGQMSISNPLARFLRYLN